MSCVEVDVLGAHRSFVDDRGSRDPGVHDLHRAAGRLQSHAQTRELVCDRLIEDDWCAQPSRCLERFQSHSPRRVVLGRKVTVKMLDTTPVSGGLNGRGTLFGLVDAPHGAGIYFVDDGANTLNLFH